VARYPFLFFLFLVSRICITDGLVRLSLSLSGRGSIFCWEGIYLFLSRRDAIPLKDKGELRI